MIFVPKVKRKKYANHKQIVIPVPNCERFEAIFTGTSVEVHDKHHKNCLLDNGFYGKGRESHGGQRLTHFENDFVCYKKDESLTLELEEACFLSYFQNILNIKNFDGETVTWDQYVEAAEHINPSYLQSLAAYLYLKARGWVVKSGIKYGGNFLLYKKGPRFYHASFIVFTRFPESTSVDISAKDLKGLQRIAESANKDILILEIIKPNNLTMRRIIDIQKFGITETIISRFSSSTFIQNRKLN